jgi:hypothetical protein
MDNEVDFEQWKRERNEALARLDLKWARRVMPSASSDAVRIYAMHQARVECTDLSPELRHASVDWLRTRGLRRMGGLELPPVGALPEGADHG